jgi:sugar transferase (PEP-CTERM/EpsH1 system associated)
MVGAMSTRPLIAHVVNSFDTGGLENGVVNLINRSGTRFRHAVVCMTSAGGFQKRLPPEVEVWSVGKAPGQDLGAFLRLVKLFRRLRPSIVHSRNWGAYDAIPAARLARVPFVVHGEHGRDIEDPDGRHTRRNQIRRLLAPLVSHFVTVSDDLRRWLVEDVRVRAGKVSTIHNGVDVARFGDHGRAEARAALDLRPDDLVVGTVGRLDPVKDQAGLIRGFAAVLGSHPTAQLLVIGAGPCRDDLARLVAELGVGHRVRLLGERSDVAALLPALDVFVLSSIAEGMSNTVLEAMATGLPLVVTRVGGNPELVEHGLNGYHVPAGQPAALAAAIGAYLEDAHLRALHGKASRARAVEHFGLDRMCRDYVDLYAGLLSGRDRGGR